MEFLPEKKKYSSGRKNRKPIREISYLDMVNWVLGRKFRDASGDKSYLERKSVAQVGMLNVIGTRFRKGVFSDKA